MRKAPKGRRRKEGKTRRVSGVEFVTIGVGWGGEYNKRRNVTGVCEEERGEKGTKRG